MRASKKEVKCYQLNLDGGADQIKRQQTHNRNEEAEHQTALFQEIRLQRKKYPELRYVFATLNGLRLTPKVLQTAIETGMERGVLDIWFPIRREDPDGQRWAGLVIDMKKVKGGQVSNDQKAWIQHLKRNGYRVYICPGGLDAWRCICCYYGIVGEDHTARHLDVNKVMIDLYDRG